MQQNVLYCYDTGLMFDYLIGVRLFLLSIIVNAVLLILVTNIQPSNLLFKLQKVQL